MKMRETSRAKDKKPWDKNNSTWHNQIVILKQQFLQLATVIGSALIQALKPFVMRMNSALSGLIKFAQNVVNALGKIFGWEMEVNTKGLQLDDEDLDYDADALDNVANSADDVADASDKAAKATKKLNEQLQGFDKLNVLRTTEKTPSTSTSKNKNDKNGSGATSGNGLVSGGDVSSALKKTKSKFESEIDDLYGLGQHIADKIKKELKGINWKDVYSAAEKWGEGLANFLNGIVDDKELFSEIGKTVANGINTALTFLDSFGKTFHWDNFGASLAAGLTSFLKNIKWKKALSAAKNWGTGIGTAIASFIKENDFKEVGKAIAMAIKTVLTFWLSLGSTIPWKDLGQKLADTINSAIKNFPAKELADTIDVWVQGIFDAFMSALTHVHWDELAGKIVEFISNLDFKTISIIISAILIKKGTKLLVKFAAGWMASLMGSVTEKIALFFAGGIPLKHVIVSINDLAWKLPGTPAFDVGATALLENLWDAIYNNLPKSWSKAYDKLDKFIKEDIIGGFFKTIEKAFSFEATKETWDHAMEDFKKGGIYIVKGIGEGILAGLEFLVEPIASVLTSIWQGFCDVFGISSPAEKMKPIGQYIIEGILEGFKLPDFNSAFNWVADKFSDLKTKLENKTGEIRTSLANKTGEIRTSLGNKWEEVRTKVGEKVELIKTNVGDKWDTIKTTVDKKMDPIKTNVSKAWDTIKTTAGNKIGGNDGIVAKVAEKFGDIVGKVSDKFSDKKCGLIYSIKDKFDWMERNFPTMGWNVGVKLYNGLADAIKEIKKLFPIKIGNWLKLPKIELNTTTATLLGRTFTYPVGFSFKYYKKAYDNPFLFTKPTLIPTMNGFKGFGDGNGGEMVYGHANLMNDIREASGNGEMTAIGNRQLANDQRIIQLLSIIAQKEFGVSSDTLFRSVRDQAQNYTNRTGKQAFEF